MAKPLKTFDRYLKYFLVLLIALQTPSVYSTESGEEAKESRTTQIRQQAQKLNAASKAMAQSIFDQMRPSNWVPKDPTLLEKLGIDPLEHLGSQRSLRKAIDTQVNRVGTIDVYRPDFQGFTPEELQKEMRQLDQLKDVDVRRQYIRDLRSVVSNIGSALDYQGLEREGFQNKEAQKVFEAMDNDPVVKEKLAEAAKVSEDALNKVRLELEEIQRIRVYQEELQSMKQILGDKTSDVLKLASEQRGQVASLMKSKWIREIYTRVHNLAGIQGQKSASPFERNDTINGKDIPKPPTDEGNINWKEFKEGMTVKKLGIQYKNLTIILSVILFLVATVQLLTVYENNPNVSEDTLRMLINPALHMAAGTFFIGGSVAHYGHLEVMRQAYRSLDILLKNKGAWTGKYDAYRAKISGQMAVLSNAFLVGGMLVFPIAYKSFDKLIHCTMDLTGREIEEKQMSPFRKQQLAQLCQTGVDEIVKDVVTDPNTWMHIVALVGARSLINIAAGRSTSRLSRFLVPVGNATKKVSGKVAARIIPQGLRAPLIAVTGVVGGMETIVWIALAEAIYWFGLKPGYAYLKTNQPLKRYKSHLEELMDEWRAAKWEAKDICKNHQYFDGWLGGIFSQMYSWFSSSVDGQMCGERLMSSFLDSHFNYEKTWRDGILAGSNAAINNWTRYNAQALNIYQATKMFYKDIFEQVKLQRQLHPDYKVAQKQVVRASDKQKVLLDNPSGSAASSTEALPLFRSSPFFGWAKAEGYTEIPMPYDEHIDWQEWASNTEITSGLETHWQQFREGTLPVITENLMQMLKVVENQGHKQNIQKVLTLLESEEREKMTLGLEWIGHYSEYERSSRYCRKALHPETLSKRAKHCPFTVVQVAALDGFYFRWNEKEEKYTFKNYISNQAMGYNTNMSVEPFGGKPLSPGQEYLLNYEHKFIRAGVDPHFYEGHQFGMTSETMAEYLLKHMVCGVPVERYSKSMLGWGSKIFSPKFTPPGLPLKSNLDICKSSFTRNIPLVEKLASDGWEKHSDFYHSIVDKRGAQHGAYAGIVDLLFRELDVDSIGDFDQWWDREVKPQFVDVLEKKEQQFFEEVVDQKLGEALYKKTPNGWVLKRGYLDAMDTQINLYFSKILDPMIEEIKMDTQFVEGEISESAARARILEQYKKYKDEFFQIYAVLKGERATFENDSLNQEMSEEINQLFTDGRDLTDNQHLQKKTLLEVLVLQAMLSDRIYDMKILFRANNSLSLNLILTHVRQLINEHSELSSEDKDIMHQQLTDIMMKAKEDFSEDIYRVNRVVLDHPNISEDPDWVERPRAEVVGNVFLGIELILQELTDVIRTRDSFVTLEQADK